jgi:hypothetical protein
MDANEWISYKCLNEGTYTPNIRNSSILVHMRQKEKIASKIESVNGTLDVYFVGNTKKTKLGRA